MRIPVALAILVAFTLALGLDASQRSARGAPVPQVQTLDDRFAELARAAPGFAGMYFGPDGETLHVLLKDDTPERRAAVERAVVSFFEAEGSSAPAKLGVAPARYDFLELKEWYDPLSLLILAIPGTVWTDIDEVNNRIAVGVDSTDTRTVVEQRLAGLKMPDGVLNIEIVEPVLEDSSLSDYHRPLRGGLKINSCTLGFVGDRQGARGFVTAHHCSDQIGVQDGTAYYQPSSPPSSNLAGLETVDPPLFTGGVCPSGKRCRYSQASFAVIAGGVASTRGQIARPALGSYSWNGTSVFGIASDHPSILFGNPITMVGQFTGRTAGIVTGTCQTVNVSNTDRTYICQQLANYNRSFGDSGGAVFRIIDWPSPNDVTLYGMHWGGPFGESVAYFSGMAEIERSDELGLVDTCAYGLSC